MAKTIGSAGLTIGGVTYGESVRAGDLVGWSSGKLVLASGAAGFVVPAVGVAAAAYDDGETGAFHQLAEVSGYSGLTVGADQYLSVSEGGAIQGTAPNGVGEHKQVVGYAVAADRLAVVLQDAGVLV